MFPQAAYKTNPNDEEAMKAIDLMYDAALVSSGFTVSLYSLACSLSKHVCSLFAVYLNTFAVSLFFKIRCEKVDKPLIVVSEYVQPENPAELGGKIYEMMDTALSGKWSTPEVQAQQHMAQTHNAELLEAEVVEPVEVDGKK